MKDILQTQANLQLLDFCIQSGIDPSGSYVKKIGRGFTYGLAQESDGKVFVQITFKKRAVPEFWWGDAARKRGMAG